MQSQTYEVPISRDNRSFEERRKHMFKQLENNCSTNLTSSKSNSSENKVQEDSCWEMEINDWINKSRSNWDDEVSKIRRNMISLEPTDGYDMNSEAEIVDPQIPNYAHATTELSDTIDLTGSSFADIMEGQFLHFPFDKSLWVQQAFKGTDYFKDAYEVSEDKTVHFKVRLDTSPFRHEDIKTVSQGNQIIITAKKESGTDKDKCYREYSKTISMPPSVDIKTVQCYQTSDGIMTLEAPIKQHEKLAITLKDGLGIKAVSDNHSKFSNSLVTVTGKAGPVVIEDDTYGRKIHLEVNVDKDYQPSDFSVHTQLNQIHIKGHHEMKTDGSTSVKEFSRFYEVPETLDPMSVSFHLLNGTLVVEAPLLKTV